jgi:hypothetical protein
VYEEDRPLIFVRVIPHNNKSANDSRSTTDTYHTNTMEERDALFDRLFADWQAKGYSRLWSDSRSVMLGHKRVKKYVHITVMQPDPLLYCPNSQF